jgi:hypothetical protein
MGLQVAGFLLELIPLALPLYGKWFDWFLSNFFRATILSIADLTYQIVHSPDAVFCSDFQKSPTKSQAEWALVFCLLVFRLLAAFLLAVARASKFSFDQTRPLRGPGWYPKIKGIDLGVDDWLVFELLSSASAVRDMKSLTGNNDDNDDEDEEAYFMGGGRVLTGRAIPGIVYFVVGGAGNL